MCARRGTLLLALVAYAAGLELSRAVRQPRPPPARRAAEVPHTPAAEAAFEAAVRHCETKALFDASHCVGDVPRLLRSVFDADFERLLLTADSKVLQNVTCMQPAEGVDGSRCFDDELRRLPLRHGRKCEGGACGAACSRVRWPSLATRAECEALRSLVTELMPPLHEEPHHNMYLSSCCAAGHMRATLLFVRLVERLRRTIAHEYGLPLHTVAPIQTFVSRLSSLAPDSGTQCLHVDESSFDVFHYSAVLYLSTHGDDFHGGAFEFVPPPHELDEHANEHAHANERAHANEHADADAMRLRAHADADAHTRPPRGSQPVSPEAGLAMVFSSGWENPHRVTALHTGVRHAMPAFFTTTPDDGARASMGAAGLADDDARARVDMLWRALYPQSAEDVRAFLRNWHSLLAAE